jgi:predicted ester cyclase
MRHSGEYVRGVFNHQPFKKGENDHEKGNGSADLSLRKKDDGPMELRGNNGNDGSQRYSCIKEGKIISGSHRAARRTTMKGSTQLWTKITLVFILILLCFVFGCQQQGAKMEEANKKIARRIIEEVFNEGNLEAVDEIIATDYVGHIIGGPRPELKGPEGFKQWVTMTRAGFPDFHIAIDEIIAEGDKVAFRTTWRGTHKGKLPSLAPTGKQVTGMGISIIRFEGGMLVEQWNIQNYLGMMQQLGFTLVPPKGPGGE